MIYCRCSIHKHIVQNESTRGKTKIILLTLEMARQEVSRTTHIEEGELRVTHENAILTNITSTKLLSFFTQNSVLHCTQYGFRKKHNTTQAVLDVITHIYDNIYSNNYSSVLTLDLKKTFDTVNHNILLHKLEHCGTHVLGNQLRRSYLSNRFQV